MIVETLHYVYYDSAKHIMKCLINFWELTMTVANFSYEVCFVNLFFVFYCDR